MAALTSAARRQKRSEQNASYDDAIIADGVTLYEGSMVCLDTAGGDAGQARPASDDANLSPVRGVAVRFRGSNVGDGSVDNVVTLRRGLVKIPCIAGMYVQTAIGQIAFAEDDNLLTDDAGAANNVAAGRIEALGEETNTLWVNLGEYGALSIANP